MLGSKWIRGSSTVESDILGLESWIIYYLYILRQETLSLGTFISLSVKWRKHTCKVVSTYLMFLHLFLVSKEWHKVYAKHFLNKNTCKNSWYTASTLLAMVLVYLVKLTALITTAIIKLFILTLFLFLYL